MLTKHSTYEPQPQLFSPLIGPNPIHKSSTLIPFHRPHSPLPSHWAVGILTYESEKHRHPVHGKDLLREKNGGARTPTEASLQTNLEDRKRCLRGSERRQGY